MTHFTLKAVYGDGPNGKPVDIVLMTEDYKVIGALQYIAAHTDKLTIVLNDAD